MSLILTAAVFNGVLPFIGAEEVMDTPLAPVEIHFDIVVSSGETREIESLNYLMKANIQVRNGGILYINNSIIVWDPVTDGGLGIYVDLGGTLHMLNTNMTANDTTTLRENTLSEFWTRAWGTHWKFEFEGTGSIENCELSYMWGGYGDTAANIRGGLQIFNDDVYVGNTTIFNGEGTGLSVWDTAASYDGGCAPTLYNVVVSNSSSMGIWASGDSTDVTIKNSKFIGNGHRGGYFWVGASGTINDTNFDNNADDGFFDRTYGGLSTWSGDLYFNRCTFDNNKGSGFRVGWGNDITDLTDCSFSNNNHSGLWYVEYDTYGAADFNVLRGDFKDNNEHGIFIPATGVDLSVDDSEISFNKGNGLFSTAPTSGSAKIDNSKIYNNHWWGANINGSNVVGTLNNNDIFDNRLGNVFASNGSAADIRGNTINTSRYGVMIEGSDPIIFNNDILEHDLGIMVPEGTSPTISGNELTNNIKGIELHADRLSISYNNFTGSTEVGLELMEVDDTRIEGCVFDRNDVGLKISGGDHIDLWDVRTSSSTTAGVSGMEGTNFTIKKTTGAVSVIDSIDLDGASRAYSFSVNIPSSTVNIIDTESAFWQFWWMSLIIADNQSFTPVDLADVVIFDSTGNEIATGTTGLDGSWTDLVNSYIIIGQTTYDYNPINITIWKDGYVPYWGGEDTLDSDYNETILVAENKAPLFPPNWTHIPDETHQKRPLIDWTEAYDWNSDVIKYRINVYMDELYTGDHILQDMIVRNSHYTFTKNLRYNHVYWVEVESFDPWGLEDSIIFSFETVNTPPTTPNIDFLVKPVSTRDDITVVVVNESIDIDTDPLDNISYLIEWYAYRENSWVLLASGINLTTLPAEKTREGEEIKVNVKPYDGIEYGIGAEMTINIVNFVPEVIEPVVEITINEDEESIDLINLRSLFIDRDGDDLSFRIKSERHVIAVIDQVTTNVTFIPDQDWVGEDQIVIEAFDTKIHDEAWPTVTINITVTPVNDPPRIELLNEKPIDLGERIIVQGIQGSTQIITVLASDVDEVYGDSWTFSTNFLEVVGEDIIPEGDFQFEVNSGRLSVYLSNALVGEILFNITATDTFDETSTVQIRLIVDNLNDFMDDPEILSHVDGQTVDQEIGGRVRFEGKECYDPDFDIPDSDERLTYEWYFSDGEEITNAGTVVEHRFGVTGNYSIRLVVKDNFGAEKETSIRIFVNVLEDDTTLIEPTSDNDYTTLALIIILVVVGVIFLAIILFFVFRKDPLAETAEAEEQAHEALVAQQQQDALAAQEKLQALLGGAALETVSGPALPSAEGPDMEALPAAPTDEGYPGQEPPMEGVPEQPVYDQPPMEEQQPPMQEPPVEQQPAYDATPPAPAPAPTPEPAPAPEPVQQPPMQAAPPGTVPMPETPPSQGNLPPPEEQQ
ncbi:MAG: right-handed parallel beta-helix repeat-containing protein [Thermoplasmatota archaeon]